MQYGTEWGMKAVEVLEERGLCVTDDLLDFLELEGFDPGKVGAMRKGLSQSIFDDLLST